MMKKRVEIIRRCFCIGLVFLLNINSFAAIVSDNDGSAFITKAEFDSLKNSFQSQIDTYNQSIDSKIDGAISAYLAGISLNSEKEITNWVKECWQLPLKNIKNLKDMQEILKDKYFAINATGVWTYSASNIVTPTGQTVATDGKPSPFGFKLTTNNYTADNVAIPYTNFNLNSYIRYANTNSSYSTVAASSKMYCHCYGGLGDGYGNITSGKMCNDFYKANLGNTLQWVNASNDPKTITSSADLVDWDLAKFKSYTWNWSARMDGQPFNSNIDIDVNSTKVSFMPCLISGDDARVPVFYSAADTIYGGFHKSAIGKSNTTYQKDIKVDQLNTLAFKDTWSTSTTGYAYDMKTDVMKCYPTFGVDAISSQSTGDTLRYGKYIKCNLTLPDKTHSTEAFHPYEGCIVGEVSGPGYMKFDITFDRTASDGKYRLLLKKSRFSLTDISNKTTIDYSITNDATVTKDDWLTSQTLYSIKVDNLNLGERIYMQWVTDDANDGGTLKNVENVVENVEQ